MAEAALAKSLDELIADQRAKSGNKKQKQPRSKGPKGASDGAQKPGGAGRPSKSQSGKGDAAAPRVLTVTIKRNAGVVKRGGGKAARGPISIEDPELQNPEARFQALEGGAKWGHDMFVRAEGKKAANPRAPHPLGTKLFVTNLHYEVSEADIKELFSTCGEVIRHGILFDPSGRSKGEAFIVYQKLPEAQEAMQRYNGVALDGQEMKIELIPQRVADGDGSSGRLLKSGIRITGERGASLGRQVIRVPQTVTANVRGRGTIKSRVVAAGDTMQE